MEGVLRIAAFAILVVGAAIVAMLAFVVAFCKASRGVDKRRQRARIAAMGRQARGPSSASLPADLALPDDLPLNGLRMIATHNSYRRQSDPLRRLLLRIVAPRIAAELDYSHPALTVQLDSGLRSFELDVRLRRRTFELAHVPLVDDRTDTPDLALALREIRLWSERNPGHVPIILLFEVKGDFTNLDPALREVGGPELDALDALLRAELGARLLTPDDVRAGSSSLEAAVSGGGWPLLGGVRGRVMVILHENEAYRAAYVEGHPILEGRAMFTCAEPGCPDATITLLNNPVPDAEKIGDRLARGFLVRTRSDSDGDHSAAVFEAAISCGANIVSTDFPPAYPAPDGYQASFAEGKLLAARKA